MSSAPSPNVEINPNVHERAVMHTSAMEWRPSPDPRVWRRRVYLRGTDVEGSHVSGVVRFEPGSSFHSHPHPRGEEILVLSGVFSDQRGDHGAGSFLLNPEGFEHAPHSEQGCELFVRLRQYAGHDRPQLAIHTDQLPWLPSEHAGVAFKQLFADERWPDVATLQRWEPGTQLPPAQLSKSREVFVVDGAWSDEQHERYTSGSWLRLPAGSVFGGSSECGCTLFVHDGLNEANH